MDEAQVGFIAGFANANEVTYLEERNRKAKQDFIKRHGGVECSIRQSNGLRIFADGARLDSSNPLGEFREPPTNEYARLKFVRIYWKVRIQESHDAYFTHRDNLRAMPQFDRMPTEADIAKLRELRLVALAAKKGYESTQNKIDKLEEPSRQREQQINASRNNAVHTVMRQIDAIDKMTLDTPKKSKKKKRTV
ncbi:MAG TPA: hypothetical protein VGG64_09385 [Pirellulales bacterium]|jgi:hypothetical protein